MGVDGGLGHYRHWGIEGGQSWFLFSFAGSLLLDQPQNRERSSLIEKSGRRVPSQRERETVFNNRYNTENKRDSLSTKKKKKKKKKKRGPPHKKKKKKKKKKKS